MGYTEAFRHRPVINVTERSGITGKRILLISMDIGTITITSLIRVCVRIVMDKEGKAGLPAHVMAADVIVVHGRRMTINHPKLIYSTINPEINRSEFYER